MTNNFGVNGHSVNYNNGMLKRKTADDKIKSREADLIKVGNGSWNTQQIKDAGLKVPSEYFQSVYTDYYKFNAEAIKRDFPNKSIQTLSDLKAAIDGVEAAKKAEAEAKEKRTKEADDLIKKEATKLRDYESSYGATSKFKKEVKQYRDNYINGKCDMGNLSGAVGYTAYMILQEVQRYFGNAQVKGKRTKEADETINKYTSQLEQYSQYFDAVGEFKNAVKDSRDRYISGKCDMGNLSGVAGYTYTQIKAKGEEAKKTAEEAANANSNRIATRSETEVTGNVKTTKIFDQNDKIMTEIVEESNKDSKPIIRTTTQYDVAGNITQKQIIEYDKIISRNGMDTVVTDETYENGKIVSKHSETQDSQGSVKGFSDTLYIYDNDGKLIREEQTTKSTAENSNIPNSQSNTDYIYNEDGTTTTKKESYKNGVLEKVTERKTDSKGNVTESKETSYRSDGKTIYEISGSYINEKGQKVSYLEKYNSSGVLYERQVKISGGESYVEVYNEKGELEKTIHNFGS